MKGRDDRAGVLFVLVCGALLLASQPAAQERVGTMTGTVVDASGGVLPGVTVTFLNRLTERVTIPVTDAAGVYRADLDPGTYSVGFELNGFARQERLDVEVQLGRTFELNATLNVGTLSEAVNVIAETAAVIDVRSTTVAHNVTAAEIDLLPKRRTFQSMALTASSVNSGEIEGGIQVNGTSSAENAFTIDGISTTSLVNGASRQDTAFEYIQEVQVKTTGMPAEYGGALGGVISAVTKSGGNRLVGEAHYYIEGAQLSAGPVKRLVLSPEDDTTVSYVQESKMPDVRNEPGGSAGGPVIANKLFFFGSVSPRFSSRTNRYMFSSGTEPGEIKSTAKYVQAFGKMSYGSRRLNAAASVLASPSYVTGILLPYDGATPEAVSISKAAAAPNLTNGWEQMQINTAVNVDLVVSNSAYATFRVGHFHDRYGDTGIPDTTSYTYQTIAPDLLSNGATLPSTIQGARFTVNTPRVLKTSFDTTKRTSFGADYNHAFEAAGSHAVKAGVEVQRTVNDVAALYPGGYVSIFWDRATNLPGQAPDRGTYGYYEVNDVGTIGRAGANITSLYVQDQWQVGDRLTLNVGVRTENEQVPTFRPDIKKNAFAFGFADKLAPRVGASYDLFGDGRAKVYGSWGRYFDWTKYDLARGAFGGEIWCTYYRAIDAPDAPLTATTANMPGRDLWRTPGDCRDRRGNSIDYVDADLKPMSQDSTSVGLDFEVAPRTVATVHYVHNSLVRTIEDLGGLVDGEEIFRIVNPGEGSTTFTTASASPLTGTFRTPRPRRQYDAVELGIARRFARAWFGSANLTISRLYGNYAGIANSDEIRTPTTGTRWPTAQQQSGNVFRQGGNGNRGWDLDSSMYDSRGNLDVAGRLATDRPVVLKLYGAFELARNTHVGLFFYAASGTPITTYVATNNHTDVYVNGRGDMGRTPFFRKTDLLLAHEQAVGDNRLRFELNVLNLFNQQTARHLFNYLNRGAGTPRDSSAIDLSEVDLNQGYDYDALIADSPDGADAYDPRYGMPDLFEGGTQAQVLMKFLF